MYQKWLTQRSHLHGDKRQQVLLFLPCTREIPIIDTFHQKQTTKQNKKKLENIRLTLHRWIQGLIHRLLCQSSLSIPQANTSPKNSCKCVNSSLSSLNTEMRLMEKLEKKEARVTHVEGGRRGRVAKTDAGAGSPSGISSGRGFKFEEESIAARPSPLWDFTIDQSNWTDLTDLSISTTSYDSLFFIFFCSGHNSIRRWHRVGRKLVWAYQSWPTTKGYLVLWNRLGLSALWYPLGWIRFFGFPSIYTFLISFYFNITHWVHIGSDIPKLIIYHSDPDISKLKSKI